MQKKYVNESIEDLFKEYLLLAANKEGFLSPQGDNIEFFLIELLVRYI